MEKGVTISVQLFITGDAPPAEDFAQTGRQVALEVLQQGLQHFQGQYAVQVQKVAPMEGGDDDSDEPASGDALEVKPLLSYTPAGQQAATSAQSAPPSPPPAPPPAPAQPASQPGNAHPQPPAPLPEPPKPEEKHHFWDRG